MLKYDINALAMVEEVSGKSLIELVSTPAALERISTVRLLYWAGCLHESPKMALSQAGEAMQNRIADGVGLPEITEEICKAIDASGIFPTPEENENPQISPANQ
jgi:hypothetical protein